MTNPKGETMTTAHTPGPWHSMEFSDVVTSQSGWVVARGGPVGGSRPAADEEVWANARLIAAAPDLLEACITAIDWLADKGVDPNHSEAKRIRAAIAKAEPPPCPSNGIH